MRRVSAVASHLHRRAMAGGALRHASLSIQRRRRGSFKRAAWYLHNAKDHTMLYAG